jgi:hypothetical protein
MKLGNGSHGRPDRHSITYIGPLVDAVDTTFDDLPEYNALGGNCSRCERVGWVDRHELRSRFSNAYLGSLALRLRCLACGNRLNNKWVLGKLPR